MSMDMIRHHGNFGKCRTRVHTGILILINYLIIYIFKAYKIFYNRNNFFK